MSVYELAPVWSVAATLDGAYLVEGCVWGGCLRAPTTLLTGTLVRLVGQVRGAAAPAVACLSQACITPVSQVLSCHRDSLVTGALK